MNQSDLVTFNQAVAMAQAGQKEGAYQLLTRLANANSNNSNILLWLVFTTPYPAEAYRALADAERLEPNNPGLASARQWLSQQYPPSVVAAATAAPPSPMTFTPSPVARLQQPPLTSTHKLNPVNVMVHYIIFFCVCLGILVGTVYYGNKLIDETVQSGLKQVDNALTVERIQSVTDKSVEQINFIRLMQFIIPLVAVVGSTMWVWRDTEQRRIGDVSPTFWAAGTFFLWLFVFPCYLTLRQLSTRA